MPGNDHGYLIRNIGYIFIAAIMIISMGGLLMAAMAVLSAIRENLG